MRAHEEALLERAKTPATPESPFKLYNKRLEKRSGSHEDNCKRYHQRLIDYFGEDRRLDTLTREDVEAWVKWLETEAPRLDRRPGRLSRKSVKEHLHWLAAVFKNAGWPSPCRGVEPPKITHAEKAEALQYFSPEEVQKLLETCRKRLPYFYNAFVFLLFTGCRVGGLQSLRASPLDIDEQNHIVWVTEKGERRRALKLTGPVAPAWDAVQDQIRRFPREDGFVFTQYDTFAHKAMERLCRYAFGAKKVKRQVKQEDGSVKERTVQVPLRHGHPHMLRHTLASMALMHFQPHWDIAFLSKWLGHKSLAMTFEIYSHWIAPEAPSGWGLTYEPPTVDQKEAA